MTDPHDEYDGRGVNHKLDPIHATRNYYEPYYVYPFVEPWGTSGQEISHPVPYACEIRRMGNMHAMFPRKMNLT